MLKDKRFLLYQLFTFAALSRLSFSICSLTRCLKSHHTLMHIVSITYYNYTIALTGSFCSNVHVHQYVCKDYSNIYNALNSTMIMSCISLFLYLACFSSIFSLLLCSAIFFISCSSILQTDCMCYRNTQLLIAKYLNCCRNV